MASLSGCQVVKVVDTRVRRSVLLGFLPDVQALLHPALAAEPRRKSIDHLNETNQRLSKVQRAFCGIRATEAVVLQTDLDQRNLRELGRRRTMWKFGRGRGWIAPWLCMPACEYGKRPTRYVRIILLLEEKFRRINLV
jgi:hypothetical protein